MKQFIIISLTILVTAIVTAVAVFMFIQYRLMNPSPVVDTMEKTSTVTGTNTSSDESVTESTGSQKTIPSGGIPLSSLPLTDAQKDALRAVNIDPDTFVITESMASCARETMGAARYDAIIGGEAPSFLESVSLMKCIQ